MPDFFVYDYNGRLSGHHKSPEAAIAQARALAQRGEGYADVEKAQGRRRRFFADGRVATVRKVVQRHGL